MHARTLASNSDALARVRYPLSIVQLNTPFFRVLTQFVQQSLFVVLQLRSTVS